MIHRNAIYLLLILTLLSPHKVQAKDPETFKACLEGIDANIEFIKNGRPDLRVEFVRDLRNDLVARNDLASFYRNEPPQNMLPLPPRAKDNFCVGYDMNKSAYVLAKKIADYRVTDPIGDTQKCIASALMNAPDIDVLEDAATYGTELKQTLREVVDVANNFYRSGKKQNYESVEKGAIDLLIQTRARGSLALGRLNKEGLKACDRIDAVIIFAALDRANGTSLMHESIVGSKPSWVPKGEGFKD